MNNKVSSIQIGMLLALVCCSFYLGISDIILLRTSENEVLIAMIIGVILGLIPVLMYLKVNSSLPNLNIYKKNIKLFGKVIGNIINILIIIIYMVMLTIAIRAIVIFVTSKYLQNTPFYFVGTLVIITCLIICFNGLETIARVSQLSFFASIVFMVIIEFFLIQYVEIGNIIPMISEGNYLSDIFKGAIYYAATCSLLSMLLLTISKSKIKDKEKYNKNIIIFYFIGSLSLVIVMFFVVSCFGYKMGSLFRYPEYILLKKIGISGSELHLENLLAFRWIFYMLALANLSLYGIIHGIKHFSKKIKLNKIITIVISLICMILGKLSFGDIPHSIIVVKNNYVLFIAIPMFIILLIMFIRCLFIKKESKL